MKKNISISLILLFLASSGVMAQDQNRTRSIGMEKYRSIIQNYVPVNSPARSTRDGGAVLFFENFDNTGGQLPAGWTTGGSETSCEWNVDASPFPPGYYSAEYSLNYNNGINFDCGTNWGWARTPLIPVNGTSLDISFWFYNDTECPGSPECPFDETWLTVFDENNAQLFTVKVVGNPQWEFKSFTFSNLTNAQNIYVEFYFDTGDAILNAYQGPFIDDLSIQVNNQIPLSGWALAIGIGLIAVFTLLRFRRQG